MRAKRLSQYSGCWWGLLHETWLDRWAPARTDVMPSAVGEAPLAADRGESALCATTSICSGDWFFGFWVTVEDTPGAGKEWGEGRRGGGVLVTLIRGDVSLDHWHASPRPPWLLCALNPTSGRTTAGGCAARNYNFGSKPNFGQEHCQKHPLYNMLRFKKKWKICCFSKPELFIYVQFVCVHSLGGLHCPYRSSHAASLLIYSPSNVN